MGCENRHCRVCENGHWRGCENRHWKGCENRLDSRGFQLTLQTLLEQENPSSRSSRLSRGSIIRTSCSCWSHTVGLPYSRGDRRASRRHWDRRSRPRPRYTVSKECSTVWNRSYVRCTAGLRGYIEVLRIIVPAIWCLPAGGSLEALEGFWKPPGTIKVRKLTWF